MSHENYRKLAKTLVSRPFRPYFWWGLAAFVFALFIQLSLELREADHKLSLIDQAVLKFFVELRRSALNGPAVDITALGSPTICTLLTLLVILIHYFAKDKWAILHLMVISVGAGLWTTVLKRTFARGRPIEVTQLVQVDGFSYPSGHTLAATAIYFTLAILGCRHLASGRAMMALFLIAILISGMVGLTRIYLGVHYPSDALSGALFGLAWALLVAGIFSSKYRPLG